MTNSSALEGLFETSSAVCSIQVVSQNVVVNRVQPVLERKKERNSMQTSANSLSLGEGEEFKMMPCVRSDRLLCVRSIEKVDYAT